MLFQKAACKSGLDEHQLRMLKAQVGGWRESFVCDLIVVRGYSMHCDKLPRNPKSMLHNTAVWWHSLSKNPLSLNCFLKWMNCVEYLYIQPSFQVSYWCGSEVPHSVDICANFESRPAFVASGNQVNCLEG
jgi:hypothetical protein